MNIPIEITIPELWEAQTFKKTEWGDVNYLVGPNGSGKSRFIEQLRNKLVSHPKLKVRYIGTDRLVGWTSNQNMAYMNSQLQNGINLDWFQDFEVNSRNRGEINDAFILLRNNLDIKIKVESVLSQLLNRTVILEEKAGF